MIPPSNPWTVASFARLVEEAAIDPLPLPWWAGKSGPDVAVEPRGHSPRVETTPFEGSSTLRLKVSAEEGLIANFLYSGPRDDARIKAAVNLVELRYRMRPMPGATVQAALREAFHSDVRVGSVDPELLQRAAEAITISRLAFPASIMRWMELAVLRSYSGRPKPGLVTVYGFDLNGEAAAIEISKDDKVRDLKFEVGVAA